MERQGLGGNDASRRLLVTGDYVMARNQRKRICGEKFAVSEVAAHVLTAIQSGSERRGEERLDSIANHWAGSHWRCIESIRPCLQRAGKFTPRNTSRFGSDR